MVAAIECCALFAPQQERPTHEALAPDYRKLGVVLFTILDGEQGRLGKIKRVEHVSGLDKDGPAAYLDELGT